MGPRVKVAGQGIGRLSAGLGTTVVWGAEFWGPGPGDGRGQAFGNKGAPPFSLGPLHSHLPSLASPGTQESSRFQQKETQ